MRARCSCASSRSADRCPSRRSQQPSPRSGSTARWPSASSPSARPGTTRAARLRRAGPRRTTQGGSPAAGRRPATRRWRPATCGPTATTRTTGGSPRTHRARRRRSAAPRPRARRRRRVDHPRLVDRPPAGRAGARPRHRVRRPGPPPHRPRAVDRRDRHLPPGARVCRLPTSRSPRTTRTGQAPRQTCVPVICWNPLRTSASRWWSATHPSSSRRGGRACRSTSTATGDAPATAWCERSCARSVRCSSPAASRSSSATGRCRPAAPGATCGRVARGAGP